MGGRRLGPTTRSPNLVWHTVDTGFGETCQEEGCSRPWYIKGLCKYHHDMKEYREELANARASNGV